MYRVLATAALLGGLAAGCSVPSYAFGGGGSGGVDASTDGAAGSAGSSGSGGTGGTSPDAGCQGDQDCTTLQKPFCNNGQCVYCRTTPDSCPPGQYCNSTFFTCQLGCKIDAECNDFDGGTGAATCTNHKCQCTQDGDCPLGQLCIKPLCVDACNAQHGCPSGQDCCSGKCKATSSDVNNCGSCGNKCQFDSTNSKPLCVGSNCKLTCNLYMQDCNKDPSDGCEVDIRTDPNHCGSCSTSCQGSQTCVNKVCTGADAG